MALTAIGAKHVTGSAFLLGLVAVVPRLGTVQPRPPQNMGRTGSVAVVAGGRIWYVSKGLGEPMALVARVDVPLKRFAAVVQAVLPTGP